MQTEPENQGTTSGVRGEPPAANPPPNPSPRPIAELLEHPDFPKSALGELVDIGRYTGVVADVVGLSLKVKSPEGATKSFNANGLRRIYGRVAPPDPIPIPEPTRRPPSVRPRERPREEPAFAPLPPAQPPTIEPDFTKPVKK